MLANKKNKRNITNFQRKSPRIKSLQQLRGAKKWSDLTTVFVIHLLPVVIAPEVIAQIWVSTPSAIRSCHLWQIWPLLTDDDAGRQATIVGHSGTCVGGYFLRRFLPFGKVRRITASRLESGGWIMDMNVPDVDVTYGLRTRLESNDQFYVTSKKDNWKPLFYRCRV